VRMDLNYVILHSRVEPCSIVEHTFLRMTDVSVDSVNRLT